MHPPPRRSAKTPGGRDERKAKGGWEASVSGTGPGSGRPHVTLWRGRVPATLLPSLSARPSRGPDTVTSQFSGSCNGGMTMDLLFKNCFNKPPINKREEESGELPGSAPSTMTGWGWVLLLSLQQHRMRLSHRLLSRTTYVIPCGGVYADGIPGLDDVCNKIQGREQQSHGKSSCGDAGSCPVCGFLKNIFLY